MSRRFVSVGAIAGIPVRLDLTWFLLIAGMVWALPRLYLQDALPADALPFRWLVALLIALIFAAAVLIHELAHAAAARAVHLNTQHITLSLFGGGLSLLEERETPGQELLISLAGPSTTLLLGLIFGGIHRLSNPVLPVIAVSARVLSFMCIALGAFNLLPALPLDGGQALSALFWFLSGDRNGATRWAVRIGQFIGTALTIAGLAMWLVRDIREWVWVAIVGLSVEGGSRTAQRRASAQRALEGQVAADAMLRGCVPLDPQLNLAALDDVLAEHSVPCLIVGDERGVCGMLSERRLRRVPREQWADTTLESVMLPLTDHNKVPPEMPLVRVLQRMAEQNLEELPVMRGGTLLGVVERHEIMRLIESRIALGI